MEVRAFVSSPSRMGDPRKLRCLRLPLEGRRFYRLPYGCLCIVAFAYLSNHQALCTCSRYLRLPGFQMDSLFTLWSWRTDQDSAPPILHQNLPCHQCLPCPNSAKSQSPARHSSKPQLFHDFGSSKCSWTRPGLLLPSLIFS